MTTTTEAKEHPIIFNGWSIRRMLAGKKTQTRRIMKPQPPHNQVHGPKLYTPAKDGPNGKIVPGEQIYGVYGPHGEWDRRCPYGPPGDVLWARESFRLPADADDESPSEYVESWEQARSARITTHYCADSDTNDPGIKWGRKRPSIHMPRELCRLRLRVEDIRVERVQEISADEAHAEGIKPLQQPHYEPKTTLQARKVQGAILIAQFANKWGEIHGDGAWERNDYVWVIEFSRINDRSQ